MNPTIVKWLLAILSGSMALIMPNVPFILIAFAFILADCISAYRLARRVKKKTGKSRAKMQSNKLWKAFLTTLASATSIVLAFSIEKHILVMYTDLHLANWTAIVICAIQLWSILENESSCNGSKWAVVAQKFMVDKAERHFDIDLSHLIEKPTKEEEDEQTN
jgi:hypothetical protein